MTTTDTAGKESSGVRRFRDVLNTRGLDAEIRTFPESTRTAADAAAAIGCAVGQIAKSLLFSTAVTATPVLVIASGPNRVDEARLARRLGDRIGGQTIVRADAAFVRRVSGFSIGGVPPFGHREPSVVVIDRDLLDYEVVWAAAGAPNAVFRLTPDALITHANGMVDSIT